MVYFKEIWPTDHYIQNHQRDLLWDDAVLAIIITKNPRKKGNKFEIKTKYHYILFEVRDKIAYVINAKRL